MNTPFFAGFESAKIHWNQFDTLISTQHTPTTNMAANLQRALTAGAVGIRDSLPWRFDPLERVTTAYAVLPPFTRVVWDLVHFDQIPGPELMCDRAERIAKMLPKSARMIAVNEPNVGVEVSGIDQEPAMQLARRMMDAVGRVGAKTPKPFWTCDPMHSLDESNWWATDRLIQTHRDVIEVVGVNYYPMHSRTPLRDILKKTADRYGMPVALTETGWHDGHPRAEDHFPGIKSRPEWWDHVQSEIDASGVPLVCACWFPFLDMAWEPGFPWPNGWRS